MGLSFISFSIEIRDSSDMNIKLVTEKKHRRALERQSDLPEPIVQGKAVPSSNATLYKTITLPGSGGDTTVLLYYKEPVKRFRQSSIISMPSWWSQHAAILESAGPQLQVAGPHCNSPESCSVPTGNVGAD